MRHRQAELRTLVPWACTRGVLPALLMGVSSLIATTASAQVRSTIMSVETIEESNQQKPSKAQAQAQAQTKAQSETRVNLVLKDSSVRAVLLLLEKRFGRPVIFDNTDPAFSKRISVRISTSDVMAAFATVLKGTGLSATVAQDGRSIIVASARMETRPTSKADSAKVAGIVRDSSTGEGIPGVSVTVVGTSLRTITNEHGGFVLGNVPVGKQVVSFRLFGFKAVEQRVTIGDTAIVMLQVRMTPTASVLTEVVTTITGNQRRLEISNDITSINVDSVMRIAPIRSVTDLLESRVPGLQVLRTTGTPGDPARLRLRGAGSINGSNAPIVVVDGIRIYSPDSSVNGANPRGHVNSSGNSDYGGQPSYPAPSPLDQIDPNSIEKIEVFKGPSASALYGADAANGVIVITTKRGRPGETRTSVALDLGTQAIPGKYPENLFIFGHGINRPSSPCDFSMKCIVDSLVHFQALNDQRYSPLGRGNTAGVSASVSGGSNIIMYSLTASADRDQGMTRLPGFAAEFYERLRQAPVPGWMRRPDLYEMYSGTSTLQITPSPLFTISLSNAVTVSDQRRSSLGALAGEQLLNRYISPLRVLAGEAFLQGFQERVDANTLTSRHDVSVRWQMTPSLPPLNLRAGMNPNQTTGRTYLPPLSYQEIGGLSADSSGTYSIARGSNTMYTLGGSTVVPIQLSGMRLDIGLGADINHTSSSQQTISTRSLPNGVSDPSSFLPASTTVQQSGSSQATGGVWVTPTLAVGSRVFVETGLRFDGGSASGDRAGLMGMPKIGLSWLAIDPSSQTDARGFAQVLSLLKLRLAVGHAGNQPRPAQHLRLYQSVSITNDGGVTGEPAYQLTTIGNSRLVPERIAEFEGGFDASLLADRLTLSTTLFHKTTRDAIIGLEVPVSVSGGEGGQYSANVGDIRNSGFEVTMNSRVLDLTAVQWSIDANFSKRTNEVISLAGGMQDLGVGAAVNGNSRIRVGYPLWGLWARPIAGYGDRNGDGTIQRDEVVLADSAEYLGGSDPKYTLGFSTTVGLLNGRLTANAAFEYQNGFTQQNTNGDYARFRDANAPDAPLIAQAIAWTLANPGSGMVSYYNIQQVNIFRFQSVSVGYRLPASIAAWFKARNADLTLQGRNIGLWTNYSGKDPNVNGFSSGNQVRDLGQLPQPRQWNLRVNLSR